jgi:AcrR family transcriptional regulator
MRRSPEWRPGTVDPTRSVGRPRDPALDVAILGAAESQIRELGYAGMSIESVARAAGTTVPSLRRRYRDKAELVAAVIESMRIAPLPEAVGSPRERTLALLENFRRNLARAHSMSLLGTLLSEEDRQPELIARFRDRLVKPRRTMLGDALRSAIAEGDLTSEADVDVLVSMLIGSFYAVYIARGRIPRNWPERILSELWPAG